MPKSIFNFFDSGTIYIAPVCMTERALESGFYIFNVHVVLPLKLWLLYSRLYDNEKKKKISKREKISRGTLLIILGSIIQTHTESLLIIEYKTQSRERERESLWQFTGLFNRYYTVCSEYNLYLCLLGENLSWSWR